MRPRLLLAVSVSVSVSVSATASAATPTPKNDFTPRDIDRLLAAEWKKHHLVPSPPADDATFFRRIHLDLEGTLPAPERVVAFLADRAPDKRARAVDALLDGPRFADHFADYWDGVLIGRTLRRPEVDRAAFRAWMRDRLEKNVGWNEIVRQLVTATGANSGGGPDENGAVNFLLVHRDSAEDLGGAVARELLGVQIQCAQCHHHPTEKWSQDDFKKFAATFQRVKYVNLDRSKGLKLVDVTDAPRPKKMAVEPAALDGTPLAGAVPRKALAEWMTSPENPWFAREIVNRTWAYLVGRGFVDPVDDLRPSNPPSAPVLLDGLAADFVAHGYDVKRLVRTICATRAYQLSSRPAKGKDPEGRLFARHPLRPMAPDQLLDAIVAATGLGEAIAQMAPQRAADIKSKLRVAVTFLFDVDDELAPPDHEGTVQQALALANGPLANAGASALPGTALAALVAAPPDDAQQIEQLYLRVLSRPPTAPELAKWKAFVAAPRELVRDPPPPKGAKGPPARKGAPPDPLRNMQGKLRPAEQSPRQQAYEDLMWALLNSSEFAFRH